MESTAYSAQGTDVQIEGTPGSSITITAITKAVSAVVTASHTLVVGDEVEFGVVTGMPEIRGLLGVVTAITGGTAFTVNIDSSAFATAGTSGTAAKKTWVPIANVKDFQGLDGTVSELGKTHLKSDAMEYAPGLQDFGGFSFNLDIDDADAGQTAVRAAWKARLTKAWRVVLPNGKKRVFKAFTKKFSESGAVNDIHKGAVEVRITGTVNFA